MSLTDKIIVIIVAVVILFVIAAAVFLWYELVYKAKRGRLEEDDVDYTKYDREDVLSYMSDFDDIFSDMIICDDYTRFVGAVRVIANDDYSNLRSVDRASIKNNYVNFVSAINENITYRQHSVGVDLESVLKRYIETHDKVEEELFLLVDEFNHTVVYGNEYASDSNLENYDPDQHRQILDKVVELEGRVNALEWRRNHLKEQINYLRGLNNSGVTERIECYLFEWKFDSMDYDYQLDTQEIVKKAISGLKDKEASLSRMLSASGVSVYRMRTKELVSMMRHNYCPTRSAVFKLSDMEKSNMLETVTSTDTLKDMDDAMMQELQLLDLLSYKPEISDDSVDEEYHVTDISELAYEGTAVELGEVSEKDIEDIAISEKTEVELIEDELIDEPVDESAHTTSVEEALKSGDLRNVELSQRTFAKSNVAEEPTEEDLSAIMASLSNLVSDKM